MTAKDLTAIATCCPQLESLAFSNFRVDAEVDHRYRNVLPTGLQIDVVYLGRPIAPSYMSPNAGGGCWVSANEYSCTQEPN